MKYLWPRKYLENDTFFQKFFVGFAWNKLQRCKEDLDQRKQTKNVTFIFYFIVTRFISTVSTTLNFEVNAAFQRTNAKRGT